MQELFEIQQILLDQCENTPFLERELFRNITLDNKISGILGPRGVGKTTFLLHFVLSKGARERKALYVSADNLYFLQNRLLDLVDRLYKETDIRLLCIDEVHKYPNWNQELKNIADTYWDFRIVFTGSSLIDLIQSTYDLSRRVTTYPICGFSFREYLKWQLKTDLPSFPIDEIVTSHQQIVQDLKIPTILKHFQDYLRIGYFPFFWSFSQDKERYQAMENAIQKTIYEDIGTLHSLKTPTLLVIEKLYQYVISSAPGELSAFKLANALGKDFEAITTYLQYLMQAGLIRFLYPKNLGKGHLRNPVKMVPDNSNLIHSTYLPLNKDFSLGKIRETFAINQLQNGKVKIYYSQKGDVRTDQHIFEIGGRSKKEAQIKGEKNGYVLADGILTGSERVIPLYLLGFLY
ncbi:MAG: ATP-binding protein [Chlamydiia bacterium]|nr:ATP-binding protein [Chlamydiia bacterium]